MNRFCGSAVPALLLMMVCRVPALAATLPPDVGTNRSVYIYCTATAPFPHHRVSRPVQNSNVAGPGKILRINADGMPADNLFVTPRTGMNRASSATGEKAVLTDTAGRTNLAATSNGGTVTASSTHSAGSNVGSGNHRLTAKAHDALGTTPVSAPVHMTVTAAAGSATSATFLGTDTTTKGSWHGAYGVDGFSVI